jgi:hypothetical protein
VKVGGNFLAEGASIADLICSIIVIARSACADTSAKLMGFRWWKIVEDNRVLQGAAVYRRLDAFPSLW